MSRQENQCPLCGRFMRCHEWANESCSDNFEYICDNPKCKLERLDSFDLGYVKGHHIPVLQAK